MNLDNHFETLNWVSEESWFPFHLPLSHLFSYRRIKLLSTKLFIPLFAPTVADVLIISSEEIMLCSDPPPLKMDVEGGNFSSGE